MTERRYDPTSAEWVTIAAHRQDRTYQPGPEACPLCPTRPGGPRTEIPRSAFEVAVFDNRFPALQDPPPVPAATGTWLTPVAPALGHCEVVVYSDDHHASLSTVGAPRVRLLVDVWASRTADLGARPGISYVLPFENHGEAVGVTLPHPHGQIYAYPDIPPRPARELTAATAHLKVYGSCVWCDLVDQEDGGPRVVASGDHWLAVVPFWARWPYQVEVWSRAHTPDLPGLSGDQRHDLAVVLAQVLSGLDGLFGFRLPYVLGVHQRPTDGGAWDPVSHVHVEIDPPQRSADRLKYLAGSETLAGAFLTDVTPEDAAARLRAGTGR